MKDKGKLFSINVSALLGTQLDNSLKSKILIDFLIVQIG